MNTLEEIESWNERVKSAENSKDVYGILIELSRMLKTGSYPYDNNTLTSFFDGLAGAIYTPTEAECLQPDGNFWNYLARLIAVGLVYD